MAVWSVLRAKLRDGWAIVLVFLALGSCVMIEYVHVTDFEARANDIGSHVGVINMTAQRGGIPFETDCWECTQPPLYYLAAAALLSAEHDRIPKKGMPDARGERLLQGLSAGLTIATLACWLMTVRLALTSAYERTLASALCAFWPTLAIQGCKCSNDVMLYLTAAACLWQLVRWRKTGSAVSLVAAAVFAGLAPHAKLSGFVMILVVLVSLAAVVIRRPSGATRRWPRGAIATLAAIATSVASWDYVLQKYKHGKTHVDFSSTGQQPMANTWADFTFVHVKSFLDNPWVHFDDSNARNEFWNSLFRSSLFGEYSTDNANTRLFAYLLVAAAAALLPLVAYGLVVCITRGLRRDDTGHRELALTVLGFLGFMITVRLKFPIPSHNDFRFALPIVPCCAVMAALAASRMRRKLQRRWLHLAALPGWAVVALCVASIDVTLRW